MHLLAEEKGVALALEENPPCRLVSDFRLLRRVLYNLLDNAIKYTPRGGHVTVSGAAHMGAWTVAVADTGVGIAPEHLPHVFERFYRADPARTEDGSGAGLGLAISRSIVKTLEGTIDLTSTPGVGTTVEVRLPVTPASSAYGVNTP
jgi:signal transduction histidine kinase